MLILFLSELVFKRGCSKSPVKMTHRISLLVAGDLLLKSPTSWDWDWDCDYSSHRKHLRLLAPSKSICGQRRSHDAVLFILLFEHEILNWRDIHGQDYTRA